MFLELNSLRVRDWTLTRIRDQLLFGADRALR